MDRIHRKFTKTEFDKYEEQVIHQEWYVPVNVCNAADYIHVTDTTPDGIWHTFRGYGGSTLDFHMVDGLIDKVKGPWHTNSTAFRKATGIDIEDLHEIRIEIWTVKDVMRTFDGYDVRIGEYGPIERMVPEKDECIYKEEQPVLSDFYRGHRIVHALAKLRQERLYLDSFSRGGSSHHMETPGNEMHRLATEAVNRG